MDLIEVHGAALEYDLLTLTHYQLRDVGRALSWGALLHFVEHVPRTSALSRELVPRTDTESWADGEATAAILADIFDLLAMMRAESAVKGTKHAPRKAKPYPRPWAKAKGERHVGSDPIPISEFESWWSNG